MLAIGACGGSIGAVIGSLPRGIADDAGRAVGVLTRRLIRNTLTATATISKTTLTPTTAAVLLERIGFLVTVVAGRLALGVVDTVVSGTIATGKSATGVGVGVGAGSGVGVGAGAGVGVDLRVIGLGTTGAGAGCVTTTGAGAGAGVTTTTGTGVTATTGTGAGIGLGTGTGAGAMMSVEQTTLDRIVAPVCNS